MNPTIWPVKQREQQCYLSDSSIWNEFVFRGDDIIIASSPKAGTTLTQQIVAQLVFNGDENVAIADISPWLDFRLPGRQILLELYEQQQHRRIIKTHLPVDALVYSPKAKYIYVARDGRDCAWSRHNVELNLSEQFRQGLDNAEGQIAKAPPQAAVDVKQYWQQWLNLEGEAFWLNIKSWWSIRHLPNLLLLHFNDIKQDTPGTIRRIARFLEIPIQDAHWHDIVLHCSFDWMKQNGEKVAPMNGSLWQGGGNTFINKGVNKRWAEVLSAQECADYEAKANHELGEACAHWLINGGWQAREE
ncbi:sulfotransferase domain-containing protein [Serratia plymuthica]|uniref:Glycolipid sulfotransferase Rv1373 n=1 Tax=Serratia plymuthica TaxID=82996 RepID=A0A2X4UZR2_SERPL|nr:sulfotransferase domain-containing protein [Serratia plymuthica]QPS19744.1 sulfotransferase domain-containing protein [Serratia plymuthica]QPS57276.1 sulfotransferase domain-containing protein [Serratia plymuthica]QPS61456.1 sulfotransferase domain-containing protein [Serratia plymuthica]RKS61469.1 aryl sulfotransferase [Serratia plymuthica]CAI1798658.1 Glycolipid sulfotransferase Rv1373 [Serratia plymuthica]